MGCSIIDYFHIVNAYENIIKWFKEDNHRGIEADIYKKLAGNVRIIWYEAGSSENPNELFTRLNVGKIPLTNAELVKALFLSESNAEAEELKHEIAYQWDYMEKELQNDSFWFFLTNNDAYQTRIDLVLELVVGKKKKPWEVYKTFFHFSGKDCKQSWAAIQQAFSVLKDWYEDRNFYHKIGYLLSVSRITLHMLFKEFKEKDKKSFNEFLDRQIKESIKSDTNYLELTYITSYSLLYNLLLLFNIETVRQSKDCTMHFPFDSFKKVGGGWSLEHIHAQRSEGLDKEAQWKEWLESHKEITQKVLGPEIYKNLEKLLRQERITREEFENVQQEIMNEFSKESGENYLHSLANLALLGKNSNAVLNNSVFAVKRDKILEMDKNGEFIPICTKMVFLKYYGQSEESQVYFWGAGDRKAYLDAINDKLKNYLFEPLYAKEEKNEQSRCTAVFLYGYV